ncbi:MAG: AAA family ATPase [bacterium]|nr:AAA family ATPase [bacterium]
MDEQLTTDIKKLEEQVKTSQIPDDLRDKCQTMVTRLQRLAATGAYSAEFEQTAHYIDWIVNLPWEKSSQDILDLAHARQILDQHHYGLGELKERVLEYLSVLILNKQKSSAFRAPILLLVGLVGTGKTTLAYSIAEALGRKLVRIPFGGMSSALDLRGQSRVHADAEVGLVLKGVRRAGVKNPVILVDEIDRVADTARGEIMGVLVELLDPEQNMAFTDHYIDHPFDLSQAMFIATCNNTTNISTAVMDRLEPITMPSYNDEEKIKIAKDYILPAEIKKASLTAEAIKIDENVWTKIVRPLGFDAGIRTLERTIQGLVRKVAKMIVEGKGKEFYITEENLKQFLPTY